MSYLTDIRLEPTADGLLDCEVDIATGCRTLVVDREAVRQRLQRRLETAVYAHIADPTLGSRLPSILLGPVSKLTSAYARAEMIRILALEPGLIPHSWQITIADEMLTATAKYIDGSPLYFEQTLRKEG